MEMKNLLDRFPRRQSFFLKNSQFNRHHTSGVRISDTEIEMLYCFWHSTKVDDFPFDPWRDQQLEIYIYSWLDICDMCSYSLLQVGLSELLGVNLDRLRIRATCWHPCRGALAWGRKIHHQNYLHKELSWV
jgi:hypothetical protein